MTNAICLMKKKDLFRLEAGFLKEAPIGSNVFVHRHKLMKKVKKLLLAERMK